MTSHARLWNYKYQHALSDRAYIIHGKLIKIQNQTYCNNVFVEKKTAFMIVHFISEYIAQCNMNENIDDCSVLYRGSKILSKFMGFLIKLWPHKIMELQAANTTIVYQISVRFLYNKSHPNTVASQRSTSTRGIRDCPRSTFHTSVTPTFLLDGNR